MKKDMQESNDSHSLTVITFDLQKTLPTPHLQTNEAYHCRQLYVYNLGIHSSPDNIGLMNLWSENEGKRGSCLHRYFRSLDHTIMHDVITFSDCCGGQNRSYPMARFMVYAVKCIPHINTIQMKFMQSGHSYLPNDTDFGHVAQKLKRDIYTPAQWEGLIKRSGSNVKTQQMAEHLYTWEDFDTVLINRAKNNDKQLVGWMKIHWMIFEKGSLDMRYKNDHYL